ncbi:MAG: class I SAM-dependent methyltransferase [Candidatus Eisenbacteria bacterium]|uniref:Class I SAM-dependent methyltransferase n=1 Tax=Eiseniibacteriota bacterium TaxID=2212470 RepID=A0A948W6T9_UNCEI|nr:class I SAM-dependent methyltransferase [Candidatus Eisenbacteria bacterium]MBU1948959.1 class I SAM-dependent methyltransferase [Candidatus Eisenbacteria bacterium]MBU2691480.1 class I SAM-dependent methyltransferase [Candidatus Eisenbacteria bacterium]
MGSGYYSERLSGKRLLQCYEVASARVRRYLESELNHALKQIRPGQSVLELGCGYGRLLPPIAAKAGRIIGIDSSFDNLEYGREYLAGCGCRSFDLQVMDAARLGFKEDHFDCVLCLQNGISAFQVDQRALILEALRVLRPGGRALFSSYAERFWNDRLEWFRLQAAAGLLGEIDEEQTRDGVIVCRDGFRATTVTPAGFHALLHGLNVQANIVEVDGSSLFCEMTK